MTIKDDCGKPCSTVPGVAQLIERKAVISCHLQADGSNPSSRIFFVHAKPAQSQIVHAKPAQSKIVKKNIILHM